MSAKLVARSALAFVVAVAGCSNEGATATAGVERGPKAMPFDGDPNGLWWDDRDGVLYIADDNGNRILRWTDASGFGLVKDLPATTSQSAGLGQLVRRDGTIVVTRFGGGTNGDVAFVRSSGEAGVIPGLDPQRRRMGLTMTDDGLIFDSWFVRLSTGDRVGTVGQLTLSGAETEVITG